MSRLHTGTVVRPRYESAPYRQSPGRREHVYGRIQPANDDRAYGGPIGIIVMVVCAGLIAFMMAIGGVR